MLRLSSTESPADGTVFRLEGQLVGAWTAELRDACQSHLRAGKSLSLDLGSISRIDRSGFDLLASLSRQSVALLHCSPFQAAQLQQLVAANPSPSPADKPSSPTSTAKLP